MEQQLIFVYNADSGLFNSLNNFAHKIFSPSTYQCNLCALTYGNFLMKQEWKNFIESLPVQTVFLHKDEFINQYKINVTLPAVFMLNDKLINEVITADEINNCNSLDELQNLIILKMKSSQAPQMNTDK